MGSFLLGFRVDGNSLYQGPYIIGVIGGSTQPIHLVFEEYALSDTGVWDTKGVIEGILGVED